MSWYKKRDHVTVIYQKGKYGFEVDNEFHEIPDQARVLTQFRHMIFLDECYWV